MGVVGEVVGGEEVFRSLALDQAAGGCEISDVYERRFQMERGGIWARTAIASTRLATAANPEVKSMKLFRLPSGLKWVIGFEAQALIESVKETAPDRVL